MNLDDTITIATPEGLELNLALAGLGSRFIAGVTDASIQGALIVVLALIAKPAGAGGVGAIVFILGAFAIVLFYPILFELLARGRTPGKRLTRLRVLLDTGAPVDATASAVRNLLRLLDGPLLLYLPTIVSIAVTRRNQRPGDIAAGTVVIRDEPASKSAPIPTPGVQPPRWEASAVTDAEVAAVAQFLQRRHTLSPETRRELAARLAAGLRPKVTAAAPELDPEAFLEQLARSKRGG